VSSVGSFFYVNDARSHEPKDKPCTCYVTLRRVRATTVAVEKHYIRWVCVCGLRYPACKVLAPYLLQLVRLYNIFFTLSHKLHDFREIKLFNIKNVFRFSPQIYLKHYFSKGNWVTFDQNEYRSLCAVPFILVRF